MSALLALVHAIDDFVAQTFHEHPTAVVVAVGLTVVALVFAVLAVLPR